MEINHVTVSGNLCRDAELFMTQSKMSVVKFTVACNDRRKNATGQYEDIAYFFNVTAFGTHAEKQLPSLRKGANVTVDGKLEFSKWTDKQTGASRSGVGIIANTIIAPKVSPEDNGQLYDDDIPFD